MSGSLPPIVINQAAGSVRDENADDRLTRTLDELAARTELAWVSPTEVSETVQKLLEQGERRIAVGGGDGTLASAAEVIRRAGQETELVCLPLGTHNHFARDMGAPLDPALWADWLSSDRVRYVDLGEANGRLFLNNLSIGLYPALVKRRQRLGDERLLGSKRLATLAAAFSIWRSLPSRFAVRYRMQGEEGESSRRLKVRLLMVSNNQYAEAPLMPLGRATLSGGHLTLYAPKTVRLLHAVPMAFQALYGDLESSTHVHLVRGRRFEIELTRAQNTVAMDGELVECGEKIDVRLLPGALKVVVPER